MSLTEQTADPHDPHALVAIAPTAKVSIVDDMDKPWLLRGAIWRMVQDAAAALPENAQLLIFSAHRSQSRQFAGWNRQIVRQARAHPDWTVAEIITEVRRWTADPVDRPSGHQAGAAVDLTILEDGAELDMGCAAGDFCAKTPFLCDGLTAEQTANRQRLKALMEGAGFLNYNEEWWHYSYDDRLWAEMKLKGYDSDSVGPEHYRYTAIAAY